MPVSKTNTLLNSSISYCKPVALNLDRGLLDDGVIRGYAARFDKSFAPGAFKASLDGWKACGTLPHMTWNGDPGDVVGRWTSILEDDTGLLVTGKLALSSKRGQAVQQEVRSGIDGLSAFFNVQAKAGGRCTEAHLSEISLMRETAIPAGKPPRFEDSRQFEGWLREQGLPKAAARKLAMGGWNKLATAEDDEAAAIEALSQALDLANQELSLKRR